MKTETHLHDFGPDSTFLPSARLLVKASAPDIEAGIDFLLLNEQTPGIADEICSDACCAIALRDWLIARYGAPTP